MTRYRVRAELTYYVEADDEDAVYNSADNDDVWVPDGDSVELYVTSVTQAEPTGRHA